MVYQNTFTYTSVVVLHNEVTVEILPEGSMCYNFNQAVVPVEISLQLEGVYMVEITAYGMQEEVLLTWVCYPSSPRSIFIVFMPFLYIL